MRHVLKLQLLPLLFSSFFQLTGAIDRIEVRGNENVSDATIVFHLSSLVGELPSDEALGAAFRRLWDTGLFLDLRFELEPLEAGARGSRRKLVVLVEEKPVLSNVRIEGEERAVDRARLLEALKVQGFDLRRGKPISEEEARRAAGAAEESLEGRYEVLGRLSAPDAGNETELTLEIRKKRLARVAAILFEGNEALRDDELRDVMELRARDWTTWATRRDRLRESVLEEDRARLAELYRSGGYLDASIGEPRREHPSGENEDTVVLVFPVTEGDRFRFERLTADGGSLLRNDELQEWLDLTEGELYDGAEVRKLVERVESYYRNRGYPAVRVERREERDGDRVKLSLQVEEGPPFRVGNIVFQGNALHRDRDLRDFIALSEGDAFDWRAMVEGTHRLSALAGFRDVRHEVRLLPESGLAEITYHLDEAPRFDYVVGGGGNGTQGITGSGQFLARSLFGRGETLRLDLDAGARFQNFGGGYHDPFLLGKRFALSADFLRNRLEYPDQTSEDLNHLQLRVSGPSSSRWQLQGQFRIAQFRLGSQLDEGVEVAFLTPFLDRRLQTNRLGVALAYEARDQPWFATRGRGLLFHGELLGGPLGGDVEALRLSARATEVLPLDEARRHLLVLSGRAEMVQGFGKGETEGLPRFERLFLGSENDLRGFAIRGVGPRAAEGEVVVGGDRLVFMSAEYQYVFGRRLRLALFFDSGNVFATDFEGLELPRLRYDAGAELQIMAPVLNLPFRFGYGFNLDPLPGESRGRLYGTLSFRF